MRLVKTDLRGVSATKMMVEARVVRTRMTNNPHFPSPTPTMAELDNAIVVLDDANELALAGSYAAFTAKRLAYEALASILKRLAAYVGAVSGGDELMVMSAGFKLRERSTRLASLEKPQNFTLQRSLDPGKVKLRWKVVRGARIYNVYVRTETGTAYGPWQLIAATSSSRYAATGLTTGQKYAFRMEALGAAGKSPMSEIQICVAA